MTENTNPFLRRWRSFTGPLRRLAQATPLLYRARNDPELQMVCRAYVHWLPLCLFSEPLRWLRQLLATGRRYRLADQRPYDVYLPHLQAQPFPPRSPHCESLEVNWEAIRDEYLAIANREAPPLNRDHVLAGRWQNFNMVLRGHRIEANAQYCPVTMRIVGELPVVDAVTFSALAPGTRLRPHYGPTNLGLRHHLCLQGAQGGKIRVGDQWHGWQEGKCLVIDDSFEHEVVHKGETTRVVLMVDCWHPQLSTREREFLRRLYSCWGM